jgi:glycosyltransferase involved in cell wall biosynthesis
MILRLTWGGNFWYSGDMRILFVADGRSPIAQNWIRYFAERGHEVYLASTFLCTVEFPIKGLEITPVAFSETKRGTSTSRPASALMIGPRTAIREFLGPLTVQRGSGRLRAFIEKVKPDLIHAMRIPFEGMLAADAYVNIPLLVSVWGNDFTLHAPSSPLMAHYTRWTMNVADALHTDCQRDLHLSSQWGFDRSRPSLVTPGNGGVRTDIFYPPPEPVEQPIILNPRGFRGYVRNDIFFRAIPLVLKRYPQAKFICASMHGEPQASRWIRRFEIQHAVELLPTLPHPQMANVFRRAQIVVSPSVHDGTPNSLLEGMACGCFPIAGDLESIREWITDQHNGLLTDATNPQILAEAILAGLENKNLRQTAAGLNAEIITERAEYTRNMALAGSFYNALINS